MKTDPTTFFNAEFLQQKYPDLFKQIIGDRYQAMQFDSSIVKDKCVIDIGAHVGMFSLLCQMYNAQFITCVEMNPDNFRELITNTKKCSSIRMLLNMAVSDSRNLRTHVSGDGEWSQTTDNASVANHLNIPCISLENLINIHNSDDLVLKIDIEGDEYKVLPSCSEKTIRKCKTILLETHNLPDMYSQSGYTSKFLIEYMGTVGFKVLHTIRVFADVPNFEMIKLERQE